MNSVEKEADRFLRRFKSSNPHQPKLHQTVQEFILSVMPVYLDRRDYRDARVLERLTEPDRTISFRVAWKDDDNRMRINKAWRVQHSNCLGPYKGGIRFHKDVTEDTLRFLAFEQTIKNGLTGLPMGGAKGGANFDPKGKSDDEIMRFCQSLMVELFRYIGEDVDVPAGDIGVGSAEIGYLFGHFMRLRNAWTGVLTGKGCAFGGSAVRSEATGYGCVQFCQSVLDHAGEALDDKKVAISGSGTVALHAAQKAVEEGATVVTLSDSNGFACFRDGLCSEQLEELVAAKSSGSCGLREFIDACECAEYREGERPWSVECDVAMPCATENELGEHDAKALVGNGVEVVCEGANMPCTSDAKKLFAKNGVLFAPGKAANAGGVAVSGMELSQNAMRLNWSRERVDRSLREIMNTIHELCVSHGASGDGVDYVRGADVAGFEKVADALVAYGVT